MEIVIVDISIVLNGDMKKNEQNICQVRYNLRNCALLRYLQFGKYESLEEVKERTHIFTTYFYKRLTTRPTNKNKARHHPVEVNIFYPILMGIYYAKREGIGCLSKMLKC